MAWWYNFRMLNRKIISLLIIALSAIVSSWFFSKDPESAVSQKNNTPESGIEVANARPYIENSQNEEWKKLLTNIDPKDQVVTNLTKSNSEKFDDSTLTAQLAKDFFSQYLLAKQGGTEISSEDIGRITGSVSASEKYTTLRSPVYRVGNLKVTGQGDLETMREYKTAVNSVLKKRSAELKINPIEIVQEAVNTQSEKTLQKLDPIILLAKNFIDDFLKIEVPQVAVNHHLALLNSSSSILTDLEAFRTLLNDPTIALIALGQYGSHTTNFYSAYSNMLSFLARY